MRKKLLFYIVLLLLSLSADLIIAQEYYYKNYTTEDGLPSSETFHVVQDKKGFIWIATNQGVSRYDGYEFKNFDIQDGLPRNTILEIFEDEIGRIWFVSLSGELSYFKNDTIYKYPYNKEILKSTTRYRTSPMKNSFYADSNNNIYIGFNGDSLVFINSQGTLKKLIASNGTDYQIVKDLGGGEVVFSSYHKGLEKNKGVEINSGIASALVKIRFPYKIRFFVEKTKRGYLIATGSDLFVINGEDYRSSRKIGKEIIWVSEIDDLVWLGLMHGGVKAYDSRVDSINYQLLEGYSISSVCKDREGGYWFSTLERGIFYYPNIYIKNGKEVWGNNIELVDQVERFVEDILIVRNGNSFFSLNGETSILSRFQADSVAKFTMLEAQGDSLLYSYHGTSFINTRIITKGRVCFESEGVYNSVLRIESLTIGGLRHFVINKGGELSYFTSENYSYIYDMIWGAKKEVLHATDNGLYNFNLDTKEIKPIEYSPLLRTRMNQLKKDKLNPNIVWIGSKGEGLLRMEGEEVTQLSIKNGLPGNSVNHIEQKDSILWLATNKGIVKLFLDRNSNFKYNSDSSAVALETFTRANGLLNNEIHDIALHGGKVFAGTNNGLAIFGQKISGLNKIPPPTYITNVKIMGKDTLLLREYNLAHNQNYIEFSFVGLSYQREKYLKYEYILEGINNDWQTTEVRTIQYPMLPPGEYTFKVKAYNRSGVESDSIQAIRVVINQAYYQTWWFKILVINILLLLVGGIFRYIFKIKMQELQKRNAVIDELNKFRQRALSAQMNPHFIYNSLNSVQSYILKNDRENSSTYLSKFGRLMRRVLENSQYPLISLSEEIDALQVYVEMEQLRFKETFNYQLNIDKDIRLEKLKVPPLIIQPYVENAIHHGLRLKSGQKDLRVNIIKGNGHVCISIQDNGIGRKESQRIRKQSGNSEKSYGTEITDKRLSLFKELYKNDVDIKIIDIDEDNGEKGTRVEITINE